MTLNYKTKKSIVALIVIVCFSVMTTLVCYACDVNGQEKTGGLQSEHSFFSSITIREVLYLPTDKLSGSNNSKEDFYAVITNRDTIINSKQISKYQVNNTQLHEIAYNSHKIVIYTNNKDGKK